MEAITQFDRWSPLNYENRTVVIFRQFAFSSFSLDQRQGQSIFAKLRSATQHLFISFSTPNSKTNVSATFLRFVLARFIYAFILFHSSLTDFHGIQLVSTYSHHLSQWRIQGRARRRPPPPLPFPFIFGPKPPKL